MLHVLVPAMEWYDESQNMFFETKDTVLQLEHSLIAISKWEAKTHRAYMNEREEKTINDEIEYIKCMTINSNVDPMVYAAITPENMKAIRDYINDPMTATTIAPKPHQEGASRKKALMTSEEIYEIMIHLNIPFECQKWHFSRLMMLIRVCQEKEAERVPKNGKGSPVDVAKRNALNAKRKAHRPKRR